MTGTIIFAGGGSGGHIFPALAIAEQVRLIADETGEKQPRLVFVCSDRPLDQKILTDAKVSFVASPAKPVIASPKGLLKFVRSWRPAVRAGRRLLGDAKKLGPVHVCALGGFVAAPMVRAAEREQVGVTMVNLDAVPGKANRWIGPRTQRVFTATRVKNLGTRTPAWEPIPPIVRVSAASVCDRVECRRRLGITAECGVLVVTTGSQGLRSVNDFVTAFAGSPEGRGVLAGGGPGWHVLHQTGKNLDEAVRAAYAAAGVRATVVPFTDSMADWWGAADVAVATAGAGNVAEVWCNRVPTLFLPYPHHKDQHQKFNALPLEEAGGVIIATDQINAAENTEANGPLLASLLRDSSRRAAMRAALDQLGPADGAARVARALLDAVQEPGAAPRTPASGASAPAISR